MESEAELTSPGEDKGLFQRLVPPMGDADEASGDVEDPVDVEAKDDDDDAAQAGRDQLLPGPGSDTTVAEVGAGKWSRLRRCLALRCLVPKDRTRGLPTTLWRPLFAGSTAALTDAIGAKVKRARSGRCRCAWAGSDDVLLVRCLVLVVSAAILWSAYEGEYLSGAWRWLLSVVVASSTKERVFPTSVSHMAPCSCCVRSPILVSASSSATASRPISHVPHTCTRVGLPWVSNVSAQNVHYGHFPNRHITLTHTHTHTHTHTRLVVHHVVLSPPNPTPTLIHTVHAFVGLHPHGLLCSHSSNDQVWRSLRHRLQQPLLGQRRQMRPQWAGEDRVHPSSPQPVTPTHVHTHTALVNHPHRGHAMHCSICNRQCVVPVSGACQRGVRCFLSGLPPCLINEPPHILDHSAHSLPPSDPPPPLSPRSPRPHPCPY